MGAGDKEPPMDADKRRYEELVLVVTVALFAAVGPGAQAAIYTGGSGDAYSMDTMAGDIGLGGAVVTLASAANQSFVRGYTPVAISTLTVNDDPTNPGIKSGTPIVIRIPDDLAMTWDETDTMATFGGTASGKVGAISYASGNKHLVINVIGDFVANDTLSISDLSFKNYLGSGTGRLELDFDNDGGVDSQDDKAVSILSAFHYGGTEDSYAMDVMNEDEYLRLIGTLLMLTKNSRSPGLH